MIFICLTNLSYHFNNSYLICVSNNINVIQNISLSYIASANSELQEKETQLVCTSATQQFALGKLILMYVLLHCHIIMADDVSKLEVILQPVEDDWYLLGQHLEVKESVLADIKQKEDSTVQMKCLLQKWYTEGGTLTKLENALMAMDRKDLISGK